MLLLAAFAAYVWVLLWCMRWYDPWRDVSQAWCIVRDLSIPEIFAQLRYEGHPFLWYALLWPLARLGLPFESILVLSTALMAGAAAVTAAFLSCPQGRCMARRAVKQGKRLVRQHIKPMLER